MENSNNNNSVVNSSNSTNHNNLQSVRTNRRFNTAYVLIGLVWFISLIIFFFLGIFFGRHAPTSLNVIKSLRTRQFSGRITSSSYMSGLTDVDGTVSSIGANSISVNGVVYTLGSTSQIFIKGTVSSLSDIAIGDSVNVIYNSSGNNKTGLFVIE